MFGAYTSLRARGQEYERVFGLALSRQADAMAVGDADNGTGRLRTVIAIAGAVYLFWWFMVELLLPGSFNPLPSRLFVVGMSGALLGASYWSRWAKSRLSPLFTAWVCLLVAHYCTLVIGNHGESTWWVGAFVAFAASSMCLQSPRDVAVFSVFALLCALRTAAVEGQLRHSIYVPGLATILLLANITKRSQTIAQTATLQAERARSESRRSNEQRLQLAAIVESSGDAIIATSLEGIIQSWNKGAERLFGYAGEEVIGRPISLLLLPKREGEESALVARFAKEEPVAPFETVRRRKNGSDVDVSVTVSPIRDSRGDLVGASIAARDISDWKRAEAAVLRAREVAEAANRELEAFNYSVAHDLRAPLRGIDGFSQVLLEDYGNSLDAAGQNHLRRVRDGAQRMGRLIDGLLALSRVTRVSIHSQRVDLSELARATAEQLKESEPERVVEFVIGEELAENGDEALLGAVIENLLGNAWKFTRRESSARIEFGCVREEGRNTYFVRDNGAGFDMAFASKLFGVFQRLHPATEFEGTGVGLATVQRIVNRHGGRVWAEGAVGQGASFYFTFGAALES
jgi:PAS domain S-box-containing protein